MATAPADARRTERPAEASMDQLICKTPQASPPRSEGARLAALAALQLLLGLLMGGCGMAAIVHGAGLAQLATGIWGGCLALGAGAAGVVAGARHLCPLKPGPKRVAHNTYLALSLAALAAAQLAAAAAATGLLRDLHQVEQELRREDRPTSVPSPPTPLQQEAIVLPANHLALLSNGLLLVTSLLECAVAGLAAYKSARALCSCFRRDGDAASEASSTGGNKHALVRSWLGKHSPAPQLYVVTTAPGGGKLPRRGLPVTPIFALPPPPIVVRPLIPAPLGTVPSPFIPPSRRKSPCAAAAPQRPRSHWRPQQPLRSGQRRPQPGRRTVTEEDVARTYTGLDKAMAEEFIDICDSHNASLCSDSSCASGCRSPCTQTTGSDASASRE